MKSVDQSVNASSRQGERARTLAVARHVTADGCQLVIGQNCGLSAGQCFSFALDDHPPVRGTVRWVVRDRVGFAFDRPITATAQAAILKRSRVVRGLDLEPA